MFHLLPTPQGLALAGIILAKRNTDGSFAVAGREKIIHAQLQAAYGKQVSPHAMRYIRRGCELLAKLSDEELEAAAYPFHPNPYAKVNAGHGFSDLAKGLMLLALTGLNALEDIDAGRERLLTLRRSSRPDALLKSYGLPTWEELTKDDDSDDSDDEDDEDSEDEDDSGDGGNSHYNPDEPRIPAGQPGGGQWTVAGNGTSTDSGSLSVDDIRQALVDRFNNPAPQAQGVQVAQLTPPFIGPMIDAIGATGEGSVGNVGLPPSVGAMPTILNNDGNPAGDDSGKTQEENAADAKPLPKPEGIPDNWIEKPSADGKGTIYTNPENPNDTVRVMPPNPDSPYPSQQVPYVIDQNGGFRDVNGNPIPGAKPGDTPEAHIPYSQFKFRR